LIERMIVKTTRTEQEGNTVRLDVEVPAEEIQKSVDATVGKLARELKLPGFRKGKVPRSFVVQRFGMEAVLQQMIEDYLPQWYGQALEETGVEPVDKPEVDIDGEPTPDEDLHFHALVQVMPKPILGPYIGLEVPKVEAEVRDADVDAQVDRLRQEFATLRVVDLRGVQEGDLVTGDFVGSHEGEPLEKATISDFSLEVGSGRFLPDLEQGLIGMHLNEEKDVSVVFPEDYVDEEVAGKTLDFHVTVKEVKEKVLPALNDEFAKDVSEFATLLELRLDIRRKLQSMRESMAARQFRAVAIKQAVDAAQIDMPKAVVDRQAESLVDDFARSLELRGGSFEEYLKVTGSTIEAMLADVQQDALIAAKTGVVLDAIAEAEDLSVDEDTLSATVAALAKSAKTEPEALRSRLEESGRISSIRQNLLREKAGDFIVGHAVAIAPPAQADVDAAGDEAPTAEDAAAEG
jgi:trigger factor